MLLLLFHHAVDVIFYLLSLLSFKEQWKLFSVLLQDILKAVDGFSYAVSAVLPCNGCNFPHFVTGLFQTTMVVVFHLFSWHI